MVCMGEGPENCLCQSIFGEWSEKMLDRRDGCPKLAMIKEYIRIYEEGENIIVVTYKRQINSTMQWWDFLKVRKNCER